MPRLAKPRHAAVSAPADRVSAWLGSAADSGVASGGVELGSGSDHSTRLGAAEPVLSFQPYRAAVVGMDHRYVVGVLYADQVPPPVASGDAVRAVSGFAFGAACGCDFLAGRQFAWLA